MTFRTVYSSKFSDKELLNLFVLKRYGKKVSCNKCFSQKILWVGERKYRCKTCWKVGSITTGSWLGRSKLSLRFWYEIIYCFALSHSARKAGKLLEADPILCWRMYQTMRKSLEQASQEYKEKIAGTLELDESFYGGTFRNLRKKVKGEFRRLGLNKRGGGAKYRKQPIFGIYKRNGQVYLELVSGSQAKILTPIIKKRIKLGSNIFSDEGTWYTGLVGLGYVHRTVEHGKEECVKGEVHINGIEGFWGLSKTNMHTYKGIKKTNWIFYIKEMEFRFNNRQLSFDQMSEKIIAILLSHKRKIFVPY